jgi:predicted transcriptional regulator
MREIFKRDALRAWEEYQSTGLHVSADEVENWLAGWGTEHEALPPKCRK